MSSITYNHADQHSQMLNLMSRLAIEIRNIPDGVDWLDETPQGSRSQLTAADILPGIDDASVLQKRVLVFLQQFLVSEFDDLHDLQPFAPPAHHMAPVQKTEVVPMRILFKDEKYVAENIAILGDLVKDACLTGTGQVSQATIVTINIHYTWIYMSTQSTQYDCSTYVLYCIMRPQLTVAYYQRKIAFCLTNLLCTFANLGGCRRPNDM